MAARIDLALTIADLDAMPDDENRYEATGGWAGGLYLPRTSPAFTWTGIQFGQVEDVSVRVGK